MTPYETYKLILSKKGPLKEVGEEIGKSEAYVSIMRKIARDAPATLLNAWADDCIPFDLVRLVIVLDRCCQREIVREYVGIAYGSGKKAKGKARAVLLARLGERCLKY